MKYYLLNFLLSGKRIGVFKTLGVPDVCDQVTINDQIYNVVRRRWRLDEKSAAEYQAVEIEVRG